MTPNSTPCTYYSVSIPILNAQAFISSSGLCSSYTTNHTDGQFYSPPYLSLSDGETLAPQATVASISSSTVRIGGSISIMTESAVSSFSLIRIGATTYTVNTDQRRIPLTPTVNGLLYTVTVLSDARVALPGYWILFALDGNGVPSLAETVLITL